MTCELRMAETIYRKILQRFPPDRYPNYSTLAYIYVSLARVQFLGNRSAGALDSVQRGLSLSGRNVWFVQYGLMIQAEIQQLQGNWSHVADLMQRIEELDSPDLSPRWRAFVGAFRARLFCCTGKSMKQLRGQSVTGIVSRYPAAAFHPDILCTPNR